MGDHELRGLKKDNGSVDIWVGRRRLHFAGGGRVPTLTDDDPPPPDAGQMPSGVLTDVSGSVTIVSYDGWYARFTDSDVVITRSRARRGPKVVYSRHPRDGA